MPPATDRNSNGHSVNRGLEYKQEYSSESDSSSSSANGSSGDREASPIPDGIMQQTGSHPTGRPHEGICNK